MSPALAGGFLTTAPPGKSPFDFIIRLIMKCGENWMSRKSGERDWEHRMFL